MARKIFLAIVLSLASSAALADDASYCAELSDMYTRYVIGTGNRNRLPDAAASLAMHECARGNYAAGIPTLEQKLRDARFTLPKRV